MDVKDDMIMQRFEDERAEQLADSAVKAADDALAEACARARAMSEVAVPCVALADRWDTTDDADLLPRRHENVSGGTSLGKGRVRVHGGGLQQTGRQTCIVTHSVCVCSRHQIVSTPMALAR